MQQLLDGWRCAWREATPAKRAKVEDSLHNLSPSCQVAVWTRCSTKVPVETNVIVVDRNPDRCDRDVSVHVVSDDSPPDGFSDEDSDLLDALEADFANLCANWLPGRVQAPPSPIFMACRQSGGPVEKLVWSIQGRLPRLQVDAMVAHIFRDEAPTAPQRPRPVRTEPHLYALGQQREETAVARWLDLNPAAIPQAFGLRGAFWCALNVPRAELFGDAECGDVDLMFGPLDLDMTRDEASALLNAETERLPLSFPRESVVEFARLSAFEQGRCMWPPSLDSIIACEAKASWYEPELDKWKSTHVNERRRIRGQLRYALEAGVDHVGFLHVGATKPSSDSLNPWNDVGRDFIAASKSLESLGWLVDPDELPCCGYFRTILAAVEMATENDAGTGGVLEVLHKPTPNPMANPASGWRRRLREKLARLPRPTWPITFIFVCERCRSWRMSGKPRAPSCDCPDV